MTMRHDHQRLLDVARLILDRQLETARLAQRARQDSLTRLHDLSLPRAPGDLPFAAQAQAELRYQGWADRRRAVLNLTLARQTADWLVERDAAARALGRAEVLEKLLTARGGQRR